MSKTRLIPSWAGAIISRGLLIYIPRLTGLISSPTLRAAVNALLTRTAELVKAVSDGNPENAEQTEAIVRGFVSEDAIPLVDGYVDEQVARINNERVRLGLGLLSVPLVDALRILSDDNPRNAEQAEDVLDTFILNPDAQSFILKDLMIPVLGKVIKEPVLLDFILDSLADALAEGAIDLAEIEVFDRAGVIQELAAAKTAA